MIKYPPENLAEDIAVAEKSAKADNFANMQFFSSLSIGNLTTYVSNNPNISVKQTEKKYVTFQDLLDDFKVEAPANSNVSDKLFVDRDPAEIGYPFSGDDYEDEPTENELDFVYSIEEIVDPYEELDSLTASQRELQDNYFENGDEIVGLLILPIKRKSGHRNRGGARFRAYWIKRKRSRAPYFPWRDLIGLRRKKSSSGSKPRPR